MDDPNAPSEEQVVDNPDAASDEAGEDELPDVAEHDVGEEATDEDVDEGEDPGAGAAPGA